MFDLVSRSLSPIVFLLVFSYHALLFWIESISKLGNRVARLTFMLWTSRSSPTLRKAYSAKNILSAFFILNFLLTSCALPRPLPEEAIATATATGPAAASATPSDTTTTKPVARLRMVAILSPQGGETYPLFATLPVMANVVSDSNITQQELLINGEVVETQRGEAIFPKLHWVAASPGRKSLQVRVQTEDGETLFSQVVHVTIESQVTGFDLMHPVSEGQTLNTVAANLGRTPEELLASNPGLAAGLDDPLPPGLYLRIPFRPIVPPELLPSAPTGEGAASPNVGLSPFSPLTPPLFDLKSPPIFEKVYYYLSLNGGPWSRVPREGEFITPASGLFNLEEALKGVVSTPAQGTLRAEVDAWGWSGGALLYIGRFEKIFVAEPGKEPFAILPGQLEICDSSSPACQQGFGGFVETVIANDAATRELRWTPPAGASGGVWQISRFPFDEVCTPDPAGLFQSGNLTVESGQSRVSFSLSFPAPGSDMYSIPIPQPGGGTNFLPSTWAPQPYYVRVLPSLNGTLKCVPSNTVVLISDPQKQEVNIITPTPLPAAPTPPELFEVEIVEFKPIRFPDYTFRNCVIITENPFYEKKADIVDNFLSGPYVVAGQVLMLKDIPPGSMLCPQPYVYKEPPFLEQAGQFIVNALNTISKAYEILKQLAIKLVVKAIPYCYASELLESYKDKIDSVCNAAAEVIVNAAMTYVGLPPSIPNYEQLKATAKGKMVELAVQQLEEQTGLPCIEVCEDFIRDRVEDVWAAGEQLLSNSQPACKGAAEAHNEGYEPLCLPAIVKTSPVPETLLQPATVQVRLTRRNDVPDSSLPSPLLFKTDCRLNITTFAVNDSYIGQSIFLGQNSQTGKLEYWQGAPLSADYLFKTESLGIKLNDFAPGQSQDFFFALQPNTGTFPPAGGSKFWLPGRLQLYQNYLNQVWVSTDWIAHDDWEYFYLGSQLTVTAGTLCTTSPNSVQNLAPSSSWVSDKWIEQIPSTK